MNRRIVLLTPKERYISPIIRQIQYQQISVMMGSTNLNGTLDQTPWTEQQYDIGF